MPLEIFASGGGTVDREGEGVGFVPIIEVIPEPDCEAAACRSTTRQVAFENTRKRSREVDAPVRSHGSMGDAVIGDGAGDGFPCTEIDVLQRVRDVMKCLCKGFCSIRQGAGN